MQLSLSLSGKQSLYDKRFSQSRAYLNQVLPTCLNQRRCFRALTKQVDAAFYKQLCVEEWFVCK